MIARRRCRRDATRSSSQAAGRRGAPTQAPAGDDFASTDWKVPLDGPPPLRARVPRDALYFCAGDQTSPLSLPALGSRQVLLLAAVGVHDVDLSVAVAFAHERDLLPVGGPARLRALSGQPLLSAAVGVHDPDLEGRRSAAPVTRTVFLSSRTGARTRSSAHRATRQERSCAPSASAVAVRGSRRRS